MPKDTYNVTLTKREFEYIIDTLEDSQKSLYRMGYTYDFLNNLIDKLVLIWAEEV